MVTILSYHLLQPMSVKTTKAIYFKDQFDGAFSVRIRYLHVRANL